LHNALSLWGNHIQRKLGYRAFDLLSRVGAINRALAIIEKTYDGIRKLIDLVNCPSRSFHQFVCVYLVNWPALG